MANYTYDDRQSREDVKKIYKDKFGITLIDNLDSTQTWPDGRTLPYKEGKYDIDLIYRDENLDKTRGIEIERARPNYQIWDDSQPGTVLISKYSKYFDNPYNDLVYYKTDSDGSVFLNRLAVIFGKDLKTYIMDSDPFPKRFPSSVNKSGHVYVYEFPRQYVHYIDLDTGYTDPAVIEHYNEVTQCLSKRSMSVKYGGNIFTYYSSSFRPYKSIISGKQYPAGSELYWCSKTRGEFHPDEIQ